MDGVALSVCVLVKNVADSLKDCLASVRPIADQIVVVDTGSTDKSPKIAARWGADVFFFQWRDDFAAARNFGIHCCWGDWILMVDADEQVLEYPADELRSLFADPAVGGVEVEIRNILDARGEQWSSHTAVRCFRNHAAIRYQGRIHEQVSPSIYAAGLQIVSAPLVLLHTGYQEPSAAKITRNRTLLQQELERTPDDPYLLYHLGMTEFADTRYDQAEQLLRRALESQQLSPQQQQMARIRLAQIALQKEDWKTLERLLDFSSSDSHIEGFRRYILGVAALVQRDASRAIKWLEHDAVRHSSLVSEAELERTLQVCQQLLHRSL